LQDRILQLLHPWLIWYLCVMLLHVGFAADLRLALVAVIHVGMGAGSLTKMMASKGLCVMGVDANIAAGVKRGLRCVQYSGTALAAGSLAAAAADAGGPVDAVLLYTAAHHAQEGFSSSDCLTEEALREFRGLLKPNGRLCVEVPVSSGGSQAADAAVIGAAIEAAGYKVMALDLLRTGQQRLRLSGTEVLIQREVQSKQLRHNGTQYLTGYQHTAVGTMPQLPWTFGTSLLLKAERIEPLVVTC